MNGDVSVLQVIKGVNLHAPMTKALTNIRAHLPQKPHTHVDTHVHEHNTCTATFESTHMPQTQGTIGQVCIGIPAQISATIKSKDPSLSAHCTHVHFFHLCTSLDTLKMLPTSNSCPVQIHCSSTSSHEIGRFEAPQPERGGSCTSVTIDPTRYLQVHGHTNAKGQWDMMVPPPLCMFIVVYNETYG